MASRPESVPAAGDRETGVVVGYQSGRGSLAAPRLGPGERLRSGTVIYCGSSIGREFETGHNVIVREDVEIGDDVSIWSNSVVDYGCRIGDRVKIHSQCYVAQYTEIDDDAFLAPGVIVANDLYPGDAVSAREMRGPHIGRGAQIGVNVTLLPYVVIGPGALIGAGSVVTRDIPERTIAYGNPAVAVRQVPGTEELAGRLRTAGSRRRSAGTGSAWRRT
jgi:acetyltransferase-like isoleucine patch superfamily enzyme